MLKKLGIPLIALVALLIFAPHPADARVHIGVYLGGPGYMAPPPPAYYYAPYPYNAYYYDPYVYGPSYGYRVYPRYRDYDRHYRYSRPRVESRHEFREHDRRGRWR